MVKPRMTKPRLYLRIRKAITGKRATPSELGYKRNPKTGRLTKPGTLAFNEKVDFIKKDRNSLLSEYRRRKRTTTNPKEVSIYEQKIIDKRHQFNSRISNLKAEREHKIDVAESKRKAALRKRQIKDWTNKADAVLKISKQGTVKEIMDGNFERLFAKEIKIINNIADYSVKEAKQIYSKMYKSFVSDFNYVFRKRFIPTELKNMSASDIVGFLSKVSSAARKRKSSEYSNFRKKYSG